MEARDEIAQIVKTVSTKWGGPALREFENDPPLRKHFAIADAVIAAGYDSGDQRIDAWLHVADHEAFAGFDEAGASMLDAVLDRITEMYEAWSADRKHPEPEITDEMVERARKQLVIGNLFIDSFEIRLALEAALRVPVGEGEQG